MGFKLPIYQDLSIEQDRINNLPLNGRYLVTGPPGTGKTVLAIYRSRMFGRTGVPSTFIVYNNVLNWYLQQALNDGNAVSGGTPIGTSTTFHRFLTSWFRQQFRTPPPMLPRVNGWQEPDLEEIGRRVILGAGSYQKIPHLLIDEAQDLSPWVFPLLPLIADNLTVFADENQKLTDSNAMIRDIQRALGLREVHELRRNYRNTRQIALLAREYYTGLKTGIPDLPDREGTRPWLLRYPNQEAQANAIHQYERNNPDREIGVLVLSNARGRFLDARLRGKTVNPVQRYASDEGLSQLNFDTPGIRILNYKSAKGLEFDTVFLPFLDEWRPAADAVSARMTMYVLTSRARNDLRMLYSGQQRPALLQKLPEDLFQYREVHG